VNSAPSQLPPEKPLYLLNMEPTFEAHPALQTPAKVTIIRLGLAVFDGKNSVI